LFFLLNGNLVRDRDRNVFGDELALIPLLLRLRILVRVIVRATLNSELLPFVKLSGRLHELIANDHDMARRDRRPFGRTRFLVSEVGKYR
jgi:hypothetical protein